MNTYEISLRVDTMHDRELDDALQEVIEDMTRTLYAQANLVLRSSLVPKITITINDDRGKRIVALFK